MFPHTVTVYNTETIIGAGLTETTVLHATILRGVLFDAVKASNVNKSGLESADAVSVYIPFYVSASGADGQEMAFAEPQAYWSMPDKSGAWTLSTDGDGGTTYLVKGEFITDNINLLLAHDDCYKATKVDAKDYGGAMRHWKVGGA